MKFSKKLLQREQVLTAISDKSKRILKEREELALANQASGNSSGKRVEETLTHTRRIAIIYLSQVHGISIRKTAALMHSHYSTVRSVMEAYKESGRTNKLLTYQSKSLLLKQRQKDSGPSVSAKFNPPAPTRKVRRPPVAKKSSMSVVGTVSGLNS